MEDWAEQADQVCAEINAQVAELPEPGNDLATFDAYIGRVRQLLTTEQTQIDELDGPDGETPKAMTDYLDRQLELAESLEEAASEGDATRVRSLLDQSARELGPMGRATAEATGVTECATTGPVGGSAATTAPATSASTPSG